MAAKTAAELAIDITTNARESVAGFDDLTAAARRADAQVADVGETAQESSRKLSISADAADDLAGKTGKATGALGALAGGLEAVGLGPYAAALEGAAIATDVASGASDALNLVMESSIIKNIRAKAATIASAVATGAATVATTAQTAAQWALNAALNANPIALIVIAVVAFVAAVVLAYRKSETFRNIVQGAFRAVKNAAEFAFNWVKDNWPLLLAIITGPIGLAVLAIVKNWDTIKAGAGAVKDFIVEKFTTVRDRLSAIFGRLKDIILAPINAVKDAIQDVLDLIGRIKLPDIDLPFGRTAGGSSASSGTDPLLRPILLELLTLLRQMIAAGAPKAFVDDLALAAVIQELLDRRGRALGVS